MKNMKLYVYSHRDFDKLMNNNNWLTVNGVPSDVACISICNTEAVKDDYLANDGHWFNEDSERVINLDFDDITSDSDDNGCLEISEQQAEQLLQFIIDNYGKNVYVHCSAGRSRSQGVARFILDCGNEIAEVYNKEIVEYETRLDNPCTTPNYFVVSALKTAWRNKIYNS